MSIRADCPVFFVRGCQLLVLLHGRFAKQDSSVANKNLTSGVRREIHCGHVHELSSL